MDTSRALLVDRGAALASFVGEHGDQAAVAGVEVQVALGLVVEVRLLEDERHPEHALPEVDRRLLLRPDERDVVDALGLDLPHRLHSISRDVVSARCNGGHGKHRRRQPDRPSRPRRHP
jgi:hypothetical protein